MFSTWLLVAGIAVARTPPAASLSSQSTSQPLPLHYPVQPSDIALFGELRPPSSALARDNVCLEKGSWAMFYLPAFTHAQIELRPENARPQLNVLKMSGPEKLQGILAFVDHPTKPLRPNLRTLVNSDTSRRAFLISSSTSVCINVAVRSKRSPDLAWSRAWRSDWNMQDPLALPPSRWFDLNPGHPQRHERFAQTQAFKELTRAHPESWPFVRWLAKLHRLNTAFALKPSRLAQFGQEALGPPDNASFSELASPFAEASPHAPMQVTVAGPGLFELRARVVAPAKTPASSVPPLLEVRTQTRHISFPTLLRPKANQDQASLGPMARRRIWLPKGEHKLTMLAHNARMRLSLRKAQATPRLSAALHHATPARALRKAKLELRRLKNRNASLANELAVFLAPWQSQRLSSQLLFSAHARLCKVSSPWLCAYSALNLATQTKLPRPKLVQVITQACLSLQKLSLDRLGQSAAQQRLARLAQILHARGQSEKAVQCLGHQDPVLSPAYLQASLNLAPQHPSQASDPWLAAGLEWLEQTPSRITLKSAYLRRKKTKTRRVAIRPRNPKDLTSLRWLAPLDPAKPAKESKRIWTELSPDQTYIVDPTLHYDHLGQVMRLVFARPEKHPPTNRLDRIKINLGKQQEHLELTQAQQVFHWIISPNTHKLRIEAPPGTKILCDQPMRSPGQRPLIRFGQQPFWPINSDDEPLHFELGPSKTPTPISLKLRVQVSNQPEHRRTLPLSIESDKAPPIGLWLHYDPQTIDPSLHFGEFARSSFPLSVQLGTFPPESQLWVRPPNQSPPIAVSLLHQQSAHAPSAAPAIAPVPQQLLAAQGPPTLISRIARAQSFLQNGEIGRLRDELEWVAQSTTSELRAQQTALRSLFSVIDLRRLRSFFTLSDPTECQINSQTPSDGHNACPPTQAPFALRAAFLDQNTPPLANTKPQLEKKLQERAASLDLGNDRSIAAALHTISQYLHQDHDHRQSPSSDALVYGMLQKITHRIKGNVISTWLGMVSRRTRWKNIGFASQSAGHEWLEMPGHASRAIPSTPPWKDPSHTLDLSEHEQKVMQLSRSKRGKLLVQSYCGLARPTGQIGPTLLDIKINRGHHQQVKLIVDRLVQTQIPIQAGKTRIRFSIRHQQDRRCSVRVLEQSRPESDWTPITLTRNQRFFVAEPGAPVTLHARGPGTINIQVRSQDPKASQLPAVLQVQGPEKPAFSRKIKLSPLIDTQAKVKRVPAAASSLPSETSFLMSEPGIYRYEVQSPGPQYLVRAKTRVEAKTRPPKHRLGGVMHALQQRLSEPSLPMNVAPRIPAPHTQAQLRQPVKANRAGIWEMQAGAGLLSDLEYDQPNARWTTQVHGAWLGALAPQKLWLKGQLSLGSENRISPAIRARTTLFGSNAKAWLRGQLSFDWASQYLHRVAQSYGASGRMEFSLRRALTQPISWDLLAELRFSYRAFSKNTSTVANSSIKDALHRYVYRNYVQNHPLAFRPRIQLVWRRFYDIRAYLGQDLWLNSDLNSIDRTRAWLTVSGLIDPFGPKRRVFWAYDTGYRFSFVPVDTHRAQNFLRNEFMFNLKASWRFSRNRLWEVMANSTLLTQSEQPPHLRFLLSTRVAFDRFGPLLHRPIQYRRYPRELKTSDWNEKETTP